MAINLSPRRAHPVLAQVSLGCSEPKGTFPRVTHPSATPRGAFDLHVLGLPPAFVLSQDQTLKLNEIFDRLWSLRILTSPKHTVIHTDISAS